jgi:hypothetical protein
MVKYKLKSMKNIFAICILIIFSLTGCKTSSNNVIDLSGDWQFRTDPEDKGVNENWFNINLKDTIYLPGSMAENGKGYDITLETMWTGMIRDSLWYKDPNFAPFIDPQNVRVPFWLQPEKKYTGAAWYQKKVFVPSNWTNKTIILNLERPHWESSVWVNGEYAGMHNSLAAPHTYDVTSSIKKGKQNTITVRIDNRIKDIDPGENSHSISDHTQSNWNGIVGDLSLKAKGKITIENIEVFPDINNKTIEIRAIVNNSLNETNIINLCAESKLKKTGLSTGKKSWEFKVNSGKKTISVRYSLGKNALLWDEFNPNVYELILTLKSEKEQDVYLTDFGLREFKVNGTNFEINGRPIFLRGTLECAIFPLTGYPPTDIESWERIYKTIQNHGLNHMRFHSWCPPKAAFIAADKMGIYLQIECSSWANQSTQLGSGLPIDQYIWEESKTIVNTYGNHPSFVMMAYGNEPGGPNYINYLSEFVNFWREKDKRRIYTGAAGWPILKNNQYHNIPEPRIQGWGEGLNSIINSKPPQTDFDWTEKLPKDGKPVVSHEIGQWCVYPNFKEIKKYTGVLKAKNFEIFKESLEARQMGHLADSFLLASGKLQALCYKADIEAALRTPGFAGFQLLDLHDFPGQGTATVGVLDAFWEEKGYISPKEYRKFCNTTVPLARLKKKIFTEGEIMHAKIEVSHFGEKPLISVNPVWKITEEGRIIAEGKLGKQDISIGNAIKLGSIDYKFEKKNKPRKLSLKVILNTFENSWDIWVYPENNIIETDKIRIVSSIDNETLTHLREGGKVLLSLGKGKVSLEMGGNVGLGFSSIFWNTLYTMNQKPHTLGILCNPQHPALKEFPTEFHSNWQWWDAISNADAIQLDLFPVELKPIVRIIDDWVTNRPLALIFEAKVEKGSIIVSGTDLINNLSYRPEARQMRKSLIQYMESEKFEPIVHVNPEILKRLNQPL